MFSLDVVRHRACGSFRIVIGDWPLILADGVSLLLAATILMMKLRFG